ncbi:hypothetical protein QMK19_04140 [Streptomyces sp. H10-C2]|uniref:hypothetical protein n=1 Tax=unclassified Streptomyces TaxID=2593676 RepID=UPI0024BAFD61|nr:MULTISPECIES: hypothetical protein [unclassified Streptomyces]MDJ0343531.1 hypothetical protein [Streptomyces sp. PH10-H1]MDJ0368893.1 hypothetical protein [Streptomyces sp. H10-C2]
MDTDALGRRERRPRRSCGALDKGHLLYQFTYFVGPVNYYYRWGDESHVLRMRTGDSIRGLPFSPHTFTARNDREPAYILALTYGGELMGDAQHELAALGPDTARRFAWDADPQATQARLLAAHLDASLLPVRELSRGSAVHPDRLETFLAGTDGPTAAEVESLATALRVSPRDLLPVSPDSPGGISLCRAAESASWHYPSQERADYSVRQLAGNRLHPYTRAVEIRPLRDRDATAITTHQHQYLYNVGDATATMAWENAGRQHDFQLRPGDSAYVRPFIPTSFTLDDPAEASSARLLALRIAGRVGTEARVALGSMHPGSLDRLLGENQQWY